MRLLFESVRIAVIANIPRGAGTSLDGATTKGVAWLTLRAFDAGEPIPKEHDHARPLAQWLEQLDGRPPGSTLRKGFGPRPERERWSCHIKFSRSWRPKRSFAVDWEFEPRA
ncbi:MAG: hypothetical protein M3003_10045 [Candidatus Dormibacteraeota bacterium]|nr:hypothetical protein [Candidatus Dormibacteraeota bacterium]MDQ6871977.1 hypothetical protein [Gemmatimonadota bacterium]